MLIENDIDRDPETGMPVPPEYFEYNHVVLALVDTAQPDIHIKHEGDFRTFDFVKSLLYQKDVKPTHVVLCATTEGEFSDEYRTTAKELFDRHEVSFDFVAIFFLVV